ncbi:hypothetical protein JJJ17_07745 [Paracoccus caeni]|uniref:Sialate O-acetylesterase domain-containing protein n=1 Tax=Paracoccus caeni TaxID=657651 RepID=A0A934SDQ6_9RHOB|nr:sialate O-acetylesterase [Paracoccus caeni]MBK4215813.1 hypothetical protein [Paracoccus caeni]
MAQLPPLVVLQLGQSNARTTGDQTGGDLRLNPRVFAWNSQVAPEKNGDAWLVAEPGQDPFIGNPAANNLGFQFCKATQVETGRLVYLLTVAAGGHHIESMMNPVDLANYGWSRTPGERDLYAFLMTQVATALPLIPGAPTSFDRLIVHQGEAQCQEQVELQAHKYRVMIKRFEFNGLVERNKTDIIFGELLVGATNGRYRVRHLNALRRLQAGTREDAFPRLKIARSTGLQPVTTNDDLHFSGEDLTALGRRYYDASVTMQEVPVLDPTICDLSVDGGLTWSTGLVPTTNFGDTPAQTTYDRREPVYLKDVRVEIEDNPTLGWCHRARANEVTHLCGRFIFKVDPYAQFLMSIEAKNDHPTTSSSFLLGVIEYDEDLVYIGQTLMTEQTMAAGEGATHFATFGHAANGRTNHRNFSANARFFAPLYRFNPSGSGASVKFNLPNPRWL